MRQTKTMKIIGTHDHLLIYRERIRCSSYTPIPLLLFCLLAYNAFTIFSCTPFVPCEPQPEFPTLTPEHAAGETTTTRLPGLHSTAKTQSPAMSTNRRRRKRSQGQRASKILGCQNVEKRFEARVNKFFGESNCELRFFMTWISRARSFGDREISSVDSLFGAHPNGCLIIVSCSMDSRNLRPFMERGFRVTVISPDFDYLFEETSAYSWYERLKRGEVNPGRISLGQNLSNLLRMGLLYRFGGVYMDTDIIVLKSFSGLRNVIGAQTVDLVTGNWTRLNNAVMIFDKGHWILREFIEEFANTFNGNKWGYNGPYLVSRVISRVSGSCNLTVLPPVAFYPVGWKRIGSLFARRSSHGMDGKKMRRRSFAVHLWNKRSRKFKVEKGSVMQRLLFSSSALRRSNSSYYLDRLR